jgi:putative RNA 2'-phosphotransferase
MSKFLSLVLRHKPGTIGLELDPGGWAEVDELVAKARGAGVPLSRERIEAIIAQSDKPRFSLSAGGERIRANYGHSIPVYLGLEPRHPPATLYHGTARRFLGSIKEKGLESRGRNYVHLSEDPRTARGVGGRHGKPVVLEIRAAEMHARGFSFYQSGEGMWLTEKVPPAFLGYP